MFADLERFKQLPDDIIEQIRKHVAIGVIRRAFLEDTQRTMSQCPPLVFYSASGQGRIASITPTPVHLFRLFGLPHLMYRIRMLRESIYYADHFYCLANRGSGDAGSGKATLPALIGRASFANLREAVADVHHFQGFRLGKYVSPRPDTFNNNRGRRAGGAAASVQRK